MYDHHNPEVAQPIIDRLIEKLGSAWTDSSYGKDCTASISRDLPNKSYITINVPNATKTDEMAEEFDTFNISVDHEFIAEYPTEQSAIAGARKRIQSDSIE